MKNKKSIIKILFIFMIALTFLFIIFSVNKIKAENKNLLKINYFEETISPTVDGSTILIQNKKPIHNNTYLIKKADFGKTLTFVVRDSKNQETIQQITIKNRKAFEFTNNSTVQVTKNNPYDLSGDKNGRIKLNELEYQSLDSFKNELTNINSATLVWYFNEATDDTFRSEFSKQDVIEISDISLEPNEKVKAFTKVNDYSYTLSYKVSSKTYSDISKIQKKNKKPSDLELTVSNSQGINSNENIFTKDFSVVNFNSISEGINGVSTFEIDKKIVKIENVERIKEYYNKNQERDYNIDINGNGNNNFYFILQLKDEENMIWSDGTTEYKKISIIDVDKSFKKTDKELVILINEYFSVNRSKFIYSKQKPYLIKENDKILEVKIKDLYEKDITLFFQVNEKNNQNNTIEKNENKKEEEKQNIKDNKIENNNNKNNNSEIKNPSPSDTKVPARNNNSDKIKKRNTAIIVAVILSIIAISIVIVIFFRKKKQ